MDLILAWTAREGSSLPDVPLRRSTGSTAGVGSSLAHTRFLNMGSEERCDLDILRAKWGGAAGAGLLRGAGRKGGARRGPGLAATPTWLVKMALAVGMRVLTRSLLRPWVWCPGATPGRTGPVAGGGDGVRCFGSPRVLVEPDPAAGFAVMKMRNPPVNSLSLEFLTEMLISLEKLESDKAFHAIIITSDCPGIFSAGLDLTEMCGRDPTHYAEYWKAVQELWLRFYLSHLVVISAINGVSPAGGCLLALSSDYRVLADNPKYAIGLNETLLGIVAPFWFKDTLVNTVGHRVAERALQLGLLFPPAEALRVGVVDQVVPEDQVQSAAQSVLAQWLAVPGHARQLTKTLMRKPTADRLLKERDADIQNFVRFISRDAIQKALRAYLEKLKQKKS